MNYHRHIQKQQQATTKTSYDAAGIYEQLDSLAVPQVTSTFDTIPIERGVLHHNKTQQK